MPIPTVPLGRQGLVVPRIGYGAMGSTSFYIADPLATEADSLAALDAYVEACAPGPAFVDTAFIYASATLHNETLVGKAIAKW
jgi:aryl-alcohol dehydrogenase-like predicted oxidoreductase